MKRFIIFYAASNCYDSVVTDADSLDDAFETAQSFSRMYAATILGVFEQTHYLKFHLHE